MSSVGLPVELVNRQAAMKLHPPRITRPSLSEDQAAAALAKFRGEAESAWFAEESNGLVSPEGEKC